MIIKDIQIFNPASWWLIILVAGILWIGLRSYAKLSRTRKIVIIGLRILTVLLLVGVLTRPYMWRIDRDQKLCVYYVVDLSASTQPYRKQFSRGVLDSIGKLPKDNWAGVIVFDSRAAVAEPASAHPDLNRIREAIEGKAAEELLPHSAGSREQETDISAGIRLAMSSFPSDMGKRICLVTDYNETKGNALQEVGALRRGGVDVYSLDLDIKVPPDIAIERIDFSDEVRLDRAFEVNVHVTSSMDVDEDEKTKKGEVWLYRNHVLEGKKSFPVKKGSQKISFQQRLERGGRFLYEARLVSQLKQPAENDRAYTYLELKGQDRLLVITGSPDEQRHLREAYRDSPFSVEYRSWRGLPQTMLDLLDFTGVIIGDVHADRMNSNQMKLLQDYVKEFGGRIILTGGKNSLSAGGYAGTLLEDIMPAECSFAEKEMPSSALVFLMDSSKSMILHEENFTGHKKDFSRLLFGSAVDSLTDKDRLGIIGFYGQYNPATWHVPLQRVVDRSRLKRILIPYEGSSEMFCSLSRAYERLNQVNAMQKGIIIVSDGYVAPENDYGQLAMQFAAGEVSVSCVAVGSDANKKILRDIARWGNGRYYEADDQDDARGMIEKEIEEFARPVVVERPVDSMNLAKSRVFEGIDMASAPTLFGYVRVKPKLAAQLLLVTRQAKEPLLVSWKYGAGRVTIMTTDMAGKWTQLWVDEWADSFGRLMRNLAFWGGDEKSEVDFIPRVQAEGWELFCEVDALDQRNRYVNGCKLESGVYSLGEKGQVFSSAGCLTVDLKQAGPGLYQGRCKVERDGVYLFKVSARDGGMVRTTGAIVTANKETRSLLTNRQLAQDLCKATGGQVVKDVTRVHGITLSGQKRLHDMSGILLALACLVYLMDVTARRWPAITGYFRRRGVK